MLSSIIIISIIACILLILIVLIQNPKGGGLSQAFGGLNNQLMGVQRTTDFLEKATWTLIGAVAILSLVTIFFVGKGTSTAEIKKSAVETLAVPGSTSQPLNTPQNSAPISTDSTGAAPKQ